MATVRSTTTDLEARIGGWYKNVPHLPKAGREWLAENVWWLALIGAILSVLGLVAVVPLLLSMLAFGSFVTPPYTPGGGSIIGYNNLLWLGLLITLISYVITTVFLVLSVSPLRVRSRRGWQLLFWAYLVNFALAAVGAVISLAFGSLISAAIGAIIGGYFLFEIHSYFGAAHAVVKKAKIVKNQSK